MSYAIPAFLPFFLAALFAAVAPVKLRYLLVLVPLVNGILIYLNADQLTPISVQLHTFTLQIMDVGAQVSEQDAKLSLLFAYLFHLACFICLIYALHVKDRVQIVAGLLYAGSAVGAVFAGDFITLFIFWELLAVTSAFLVFARRTQASKLAGIRYLIIQVLSGVLLLIGAISYFQQTGSTDIGYIGLGSMASWLFLIAFGIKAAFPFMHSWLTDAYPEATPAGAVFLSAFTTKVAIYMLARTFPGEDLLVYIGAAMTCFPIFYAVIENDLRKVLAYSLINQLGFMVCGIGIGTALALNGTVAHAFNDVIFKGLLFMTMGAVLHRVGHVNGSNLGGLYKTMPKTTIFCIVGAASISAFPLFSGFVSKSMVMAAMIEAGHEYLWLMLLFASAGVFHHAGIKIPFFAFFAHDSGLRPKEAPTNMLVAMGIASFICILVGTYPEFLYQMLPWDMEKAYVPYDLTHTLTQLQLLFFSALAFVWLNKKGLYPPELKSVNLDTEWLYRKVLPTTGNGLARIANNIKAGVIEISVSAFNALPVMKRGNDANAATLTLRMALGFVVLAVLAFVTQFM
ncbi:Na(+)/H(+) antiporter subunit D [Brumicola nitratireducens]|uniref:Putative monovalent cation/H+ antiporter subunit D n=1 Tax=Glaciecola nitratireducens (strain JCM 12485 / KCTC 12276 / FR1064) TaxID=1085623 RepID=G4QK80_GLANF|nr:Na(+)/H(+) antiporter subunit D [Glaciecola nitratireducens]AEP29279.1 putative monovalent cation/H+ antiporter subunit D [Glaciecola nitratireducens FR1064]